MKQVKRTGLIFTIVGIAITILFITMTINQIAFRKTATKSTATITKIVTYYETDSDGARTTKHDVTIKYEANEIEYEKMIGDYSSSWREGKEITIYYDQNNPDNVKTDTSLFLTILFIPFGLIFVGTGLKLYLGESKVKNKRKNLMATGSKITVQITNVILNQSFKVNGQSPYIIECTWHNPSDGISYILKSENIWFNPKPIIEQNNIQTMDAYIDMANQKQYYIDIENIENSTKIL